MVNLLPTKRKLYQTRLTSGSNRGGLTHADEVHGAVPCYMVSQLGSKFFSGSFLSTRSVNVLKTLCLRDNGSIDSCPDRADGSNKLMTGRVSGSVAHGTGSRRIGRLMVV